MRMCTRHWDALRAAIADCGLSALVADDGERAASNLASEINEGRTIDNFDPLMGANMAISTNAMRLAGEAAGPGGVMELLATTPAGAHHCPICYICQKHDEHCSGPPCVLPKDGTAYDAWIDHAAGEMVDAWKALNA